MADVSLQGPTMTDEARRRARVRNIALALLEGASDLASAVELVKVLLEVEIAYQRVRAPAVTVGSRRR